MSKYSHARSRSRSRSRGEISAAVPYRCMRSAFRNLVAYERARVLSNDLHRVVLTWPKFERWSLGIQLMRAVDSIGANIAEAAGRMHAPDRRRFLIIARGSLYETEHWLATAEDRGLLNRAVGEPLEEIARTLEGLIAKQNPSRSASASASASASVSAT